MLTIVLSFSHFVAIVLLVLISVQQRRWRRKSRRVLQRTKAEETLKPESIHEPLPFLQFSPATSDFRCIWHYTSTGRKCKNSIDQRTDRCWANTLRNTIADDTPYSERVENMLREYAEFCICRLHRPNIHTSPNIVNGWVQQWLVEIRALHDSLHEGPGEEDSPVGEGVLLYPPTTIPEPLSDEGSPDVENRIATIIPLKCETVDHLTPTTTKVPGSFPDDDTLHTLGWHAMASQPDPDARRSSTPATPSPRRYSRAVRDSPSGVQRISFRRISSATPRLQSRRTAEFEPYPKRHKRTLLDILNTPLGENESKSGYVYIFTRRSDEDTHSLYIKIGVAKHVGDRFEGWKTKCHYKPHLEYHTARIPNAMRVELLIHTELIESRYIEQRCSGCSGMHDEWFKTDIGSARPVVERWAQWMRENRPYTTPEGQLSSHVVKQILEHKRSKFPLTSRTMLALTINNVAAVQPAPQSPPGNTERRRTVPSIEALDPASPCLRKSTLRRNPVTDSAAATVDNERDEVESSSLPSPSPSPVRAHAPLTTNDRGLAVTRKRKRASFAKEDREPPTSPTKISHDVDVDVVKVKVEPDMDLDDLFVSDVEMSDAKESYHDAEPFPESSSGRVAVKNELGTLPAGCKQDPDEAPEGPPTARM